MFRHRDRLRWVVSLSKKRQPDEDRLQACNHCFWYAESRPRTNVAPIREQQWRFMGGFAPMGDTGGIAVIDRPREAPALKAIRSLSEKKSSLTLLYRSYHRQGGARSRFRDALCHLRWASLRLASQSCSSSVSDLRMSVARATVRSGDGAGLVEFADGLTIATSRTFRLRASHFSEQPRSSELLAF